MEKEPLHTFEHAPQPDKREHEVKESLFSEIVADKLAEVFENELEAHGFDRENRDQFIAEAAADRNEDIDIVKNILAVPWSLRQRWLSEAASQGLDGRLVYQMLKDKYEGHHEQFGVEPLIGYHTSEKDISIEKPKSKLKKPKWEVIGTEQSDLADGPQAYAAETYESLYRARAPRYIYIVRISDRDKKYGEGETSWYYNTTFPIVAQLDLEAVDDEIDKQYAEIKNARAEERVSKETSQYNDQTHVS